MAGPPQIMARSVVGVDLRQTDIGAEFAAFNQNWQATCVTEVFAGDAWVVDQLLFDFFTQKVVVWQLCGR